MAFLKCFGEVLRGQELQMFLYRENFRFLMKMVD